MVLSLRAKSMKYDPIIAFWETFAEKFSTSMTDWIDQRFESKKLAQPKSDSEPHRRVLICGATQVDDCLCVAVDSTGSVYYAENDYQADVVMDFEEEEMNPCTRDTDQTGDEDANPIVPENGEHKDLLAKIEDPSALINQVCVESIQDKVISVPKCEFSSPNLAVNTREWAFFANKKEIGVACKVFDEMPNRDKSSWSVLIAVLSQYDDCLCVVLNNPNQPMYNDSGGKTRAMHMKALSADDGVCNGPNNHELLLGVKLSQPTNIGKTTSATFGLPEINGKISELVPPKGFVESLQTKNVYNNQLGNAHNVSLLEWKLTYPTSYLFFVGFIKARVSNKLDMMEHMAYLLVELDMLNYTMVMYCLSMVVALAVYGARCNLNKNYFWNETLKHHMGFSESQLINCAKILVSFHSSAAENKLKLIFCSILTTQRGMAKARETRKCNSNVQRTILVMQAIIGDSTGLNFGTTRCASAMAEQLGTAGLWPLVFICTIMIFGKTGVGKSATIKSLSDQLKYSTDAFSVGLHAWTFSLTNFAQIYASIFGVDKAKMMGPLVFLIVVVKEILHNAFKELLLINVENEFLIVMCDIQCHLEDKVDFEGRDIVTDYVLACRMGRMGIGKIQGLRSILNS